MGIFSRSRGPSNRHSRYGTGTTSTVNDPDYDDGVHDGMHDDVHRNKLTHNTGRHGRRFGSRSSEKPRRARGHREKRPLFDINSGYYNRRPSFGTWVKHTWLDILTMIIMGAIGLGVYEADPAPTRSFPVTFANGNTVYPEFAYPLRKEIIPIWLAALLASLIPIFIILVMQIRIKSFWDVNNGVIGLLYSLIGAAVFQVFVKWLIGGLRPHFLDVCAPDVNKVTAGGGGFRSLMYTADICTGDRDQINDSLESMPSGHSTAAWAGFLYLYFYLNAKLKVFSNHHPAMWKLIALYAPVLGATLITGSLTIDEFHNWYDCLAGAIIGSVFAISSYRMVYASVWDFRFNHIPLTRHTPFSYGAGAAGAGGFESAVFTHKAGWGYEEAYGGAPFDSAFALRGAGGGGMTGNENTIGLGSKNTGYRGGDVEHHAGAGGLTTGTGIGHHHDHNRGIGGTTTAGTGRHHDYDRGIEGTTTTGIGRNHDHNRGLGGTTTGVGHHHDYDREVRDTTTGGIGHHHDNVNPPYYSQTTSSGITHPTSTHDSALHRDGDYTTGDDYAREGRSTTIGDNRYRSHRKSLERKALAANMRNEPTY